MKRIMTLVWCGVCSIILSSHGEMIIVNPGALIRERMPYYEKYLQLAGEIAEQTGDAEAKEVMQFLKEKTILGAPIPLGIVINGPIGNEARLTIKLIPFLASDRWPGTMWESYGAHQTITLFDGPMRYILVYEYIEASPKWKGLLILTSAHAAFRFLLEPVPRSDQVKNLKLQAGSFEFMLRLLNKMGGLPYYRAVRTEVIKSRLQMVTEGKRSFELLHSGLANSDLEPVFGAPLSPFERSNRQAIFSINIGFQLIEEDAAVPADEKRTAKAFFLKRFMTTPQPGHGSPETCPVPSEPLRNT